MWQTLKLGSHHCWSSCLHKYHLFWLGVQKVRQILAKCCFTSFTLENRPELWFSNPPSFLKKINHGFFETLPLVSSKSMFFSGRSKVKHPYKLEKLFMKKQQFCFAKPWHKSKGPGTLDFQNLHWKLAVQSATPPNSVASLADNKLVLKCQRGVSRIPKIETTTFLLGGSSRSWISHGYYYHPPFFCRENEAILEGVQSQPYHHGDPWLPPSSRARKSSPRSHPTDLDISILCWWGEIENTSQTKTNKNPDIYSGWWFCFNPFEKYARQNGFIFPKYIGVEIKNIWVATT